MRRGGSTLGVCVRVSGRCGGGSWSKKGERATIKQAPEFDYRGIISWGLTLEDKHNLAVFGGMGAANI